MFSVLVIAQPEAERAWVRGAVDHGLVHEVNQAGAPSDPEEPQIGYFLRSQQALAAGSAVGHSLPSWLSGHIVYRSVPHA